MAKVIAERPSDADAIREVNELAFGGPKEADLVDELRSACDDLMSLVALDGSRLVGHILFSPVVIEGPKEALKGMGLGPMAVLPDCQGWGVGTSLVRAGLAGLRRRSCPFVVVLGHPDYYPRFGFVKASTRSVRCQWEGVPDEAFMILVLNETVPCPAGVAWYREEFDKAI